jgi:hypothetical protein
MALPPTEDHTDQAEQLTLFSPEELAELESPLLSQPPTAAGTLFSQTDMVRKPHRPKGEALQDELPFCR